MPLSRFNIETALDGFEEVFVDGKAVAKGLQAINIRLEKGSLPLVVLEFQGEVADLVGEGIVHVVANDIFPEKAADVEDLVLRKMDELGCSMGEAILALRRRNGSEAREDQEVR